MTSSSGTLIHFCKESLERGEKQNEFIEEELRLGALTRRITRLKSVYYILNTIFEKNKLGKWMQRRKRKYGSPYLQRGVL
jgi:hypothetical protein